MDKKGFFIHLLLLSALNYMLSAPAMAADAGASRLAMADAMLSMMDTMGLFGRSSEPIDKSGYSRGWRSLSPDADSAARHSVPAPWSGFPTEYPRPRRIDSRSTLVRLQGDWLSKSGERLQIRGSRFRLLAGPGREVQGMLYLRNNLLALRSHRHDRTWTYEYAEHAGSLALRDARDRLYLYRRIKPHYGKFPEQSGANPAPGPRDRNSSRYPDLGALRRQY